jgi:DNA-binding PadR family transcriptional regulator
MTRDVPVRGHLDLMLLAVLSAGPGHGYAVIERLRARSGGVFALPQGTIYPALHRLEQEGLVSSQPAVVSGRRRRVYELTRRGRAQLRDRQRAWDTFALAVNGVLGGAPSATTT